MPKADAETTTGASWRSNDEIRRDIKQEDEERLHKERDEFQGWYAEWLANRAAMADPDKIDDWTNGSERAHSDREEELARMITTTPSVLPWMIWQKIEILEHYLVCGGSGTSWADQREIVMLAGIKADLIRLSGGDWQ